MNKIKILSPSEAQKIAAGECVERPANIVKELVENSIDAGASSISIFIEQAGKKLIRVVDDGYGLSPEDALLCFLPHATSKITSVDDLETISSFGFRGEALASISAVSQVKLITRSKETSTNGVGTQIEYSQCSLINQSEVASAQGTDIQVHELFYNTPARKKFLKQDETEWNQILSLFQAFCLSHLQISFKLHHDGKLALNAPAAPNLKDRISQLWDFNIAQNVIQLQPATMPEWLKIEGYISHQSFWRYNRNHIFFFVNGRWIKNIELSKALVKSYLNVLPPGRFPAGFIFIKTESNLVDVNVHPKKEEVRFIKPVTVENALFNSVKQTLEQQVTQKLAPTFTQLQFEQQPQNLTPPSFENYIFTPSPYSLFSAKSEDSNRQEKKLAQDQQQTFEPIVAMPNQKIIGQLFNTYILIENKDEFIVVDQHAAHERILYEKYLKNFELKDGIKLLFPETVELQTQSMQRIMEHQDFFASQGFELEPISDTTIAIRSTPTKLNKQSIRELIVEAVEFIKENDQLDTEEFRKKLNEHVHSQAACKAAIKAGDILTQEQMQKLITDLSKTEKRFICVHGRPTIWTISKDSIERQFKRKQ
jgi:DNA mismatch repair protein MutL